MNEMMQEAQRMKLTSLLERLEYTCVQGSLDREISGIANDSRQVVPGTLFFSIRGAVTDGHTYAAEVAEKGAVSLLVEEPVEVPESVTVIQVKDTRYAMAMFSRLRITAGGILSFVVTSSQGRLPSSRRALGPNRWRRWWQGNFRRPGFFGWILTRPGKRTATRKFFPPLQTARRTFSSGPR